MSESLGEKIQRVLQEAPFAMRQLAADAGLSYDVLRSWRSGRRRPSRTSAARLAAGLQQRGELLLRLAGELREASGVEETAPQETGVRDRSDGAGSVEGRGGQWGQGPGRRPEEGPGRGADDVVRRRDEGSTGWQPGRPPFDSSAGNPGQGGASD